MIISVGVVVVWLLLWFIFVVVVCLCVSFFLCVSLFLFMKYLFVIGCINRLVMRLMISMLMRMYMVWL